MGGVSFPGKKRHEGARFNVISVTRRWMGVKFPGKKRYVTLEWAHTAQDKWACKRGCQFAAVFGIIPVTMMSLVRLLTQCVHLCFGLPLLPGEGEDQPITLAEPGSIPLRNWN